MNEHVFDASCTLPTRPKWHWIIVAYFHDASKMYRTRHLNRLLYFNVILDASCKFSTRRNDIYDPSARIINNLLNSTIFWTRHLNSATRPLNSATRQILHWNIVAYFGEASSQLCDASAQLRDASKMQLWPQWLTIAPRGLYSPIMVNKAAMASNNKIEAYKFHPRDNSIKIAPAYKSAWNRN